MSDFSSGVPYPLPLSTFERYVLADDRPAYPMAFVVQVQLSGRLRQSAFESALEEVLGRHPLFCALVDPSARAGPCWIPAGRLRPPVDWNLQGRPLVCPHGERIDLSSEVGLRIWVRQGDRASEITFQVHHCCSDGLGMMQFIGDLLAAYGIRTSSASPRPILQPVAPARLTARSQFTVELPTSTSRMRARWETIREAVKWLGRTPTPLHLPNSASRDCPVQPAFPGFCSHTLDPQQTRSLRLAAKRHNATLNDVVLRDVFLTIRQWNARHRPGRPGRRFGINMPTSLRERRHDRMPAANVMSHTFLTRRSRDCEDGSRLLESIRAETELIKRWRLGLYFIGGIALMQRIRGAMPLAMKLAGNRCYATVAVTNVGDPSRRFTARFPRCSGRIVAGNVTLEGMTGVPPLRPKTRAVFGVAVYCGELTVVVRCDPHVFSLEDTGQLLALYGERLERTAAETC